MMNYWRNIGRKYKAVGWLLVTAMAFLTVLPAHVHFLSVENHAESNHGHAHVVDMHIYSSAHNPPHHDDTQVLMSSPDGMIKGLYFKISPMLIIGLLIGIVAFALARFTPRQRTDIFLPIERTYHFSPPLRGPPH